MKLTKPERLRLKQLVADSLLSRLTIEETLNYVERSLHIRLGPDYIIKIRKWLKADMQKEYATLRQDKYAYISEYFQRINEIRDLQRGTRFILCKTNDDALRLKCISELHSLTLSLTNLYDLLPAITERSFYNAPDYASPSKVVSGQTTTEATIPNTEPAVSKTPKLV